MRAFSRFHVLALLVFATIFVFGCTEEPSAPTLDSQTITFDKGIPAGYYDTVDTATSSALRLSLHDVIDDHTRIPYTSSATDTWNVLEQADQDPLNASHVLDVYMNESYVKHGAGNTDYNREHSWPKSYGFPNDGSSNYPYTDCHHLFISNDSRNSSRSNKPYGTASGSGTEYVTLAYNGVGGGSGVYPGWSNWASTTYWETWQDRRGDVARALFYLDVRYEGGTHGVTGHSEPDLILTDQLSLITASNTGSNGSVAYMGLLAVLLQWHADDPVDAKEQARNDAIYSHQGNRNPFIDHPEWIDCVFNGGCGGSGGDTTPPAAPTGMGATAGDGTVSLDWADNGESDLDHYTVYRATTSGGSYTSLGNVTVSTYADNGVTNGTTYWYVVTASDASSNESAQSSEASATPQGGGGGGDPVAWINEFHYDNSGSDTGEFVEVAATAGVDLAGWSIVAYNGNGGSSYKTVSLNGVMADQQGGFGTLSFAVSGLQNGAPDGIALVDDTSTVVEFLSYEGTFTATDGAASGMTSVNVGVSETSSTSAGWSLQLAGSGAVASDFTWQSAQADTPGLPNTGQTFTGGGPVNQAPTAVANGSYSANEGVSISFSSAGSTDTDGTIVSWFWNFGDGATSTAADPSHAYTNAGSYVATLTVTDDQGATDDDTATVTISDVTAPAAPTGLGAVAGNAVVDLSWTANGESDFDHYTVYRSTTSGSGYSALGTMTSITYSDALVTNGTTYYYVVAATDGTGNESGWSTETSATPTAPIGSGADVWINEFHYDNDGSDTGEFFEVAGAMGTDLTGWSVVAYNGNGGVTYATVNLSGTLPATEGGFGVLSFNLAGLQNGAPDGFALVDDTGSVVQFLSYEGVVSATNGPAVGLSSEDVGVSEASTSPVGHSLQLSGTGSTYTDFSWQASAANTSGTVNAGQTLGDGSGGGGGGSWVVLTYDDFESGMGNYQDGGGDMRRYTGGTYAHQGSAAANIQDNSGTSSSFYHAAGTDVSGYSDLEVEFWFYAKSMESGEDFWVQYWDGSTWQTIATYARGTDFNNGEFLNQVVTIPAGTFAYPTDAKLRFMCDASGNKDDVYIDEVEFRGFQ